MQEQKLNKIKKIIKILNYSTGGLMFAFGLTGIIIMGINSIFSGKFFLIFSPIFMMLFGIVIVVTECQIKFMMKHLGFLNSLIGRAIFNFYMASIVFYYFQVQGTEVVGWILGIILFLFAIVYLIFHFCWGSKVLSKDETETERQMA